MAVRTLLDWHDAGEDVDRRMPELSTFLGHLDPESTYWYLQAVPELMALISARLERLAEVLEGKGIPLSWPGERARTRIYRMSRRVRRRLRDERSPS